MLLDVFLNNAWLAISLWALLYFSDHTLTLKAAKMYQSGANKHFGFAGGYELNPIFKDDVANLRRFGFRFFLMLFVVSGLMFLIDNLGVPELFAFFWGMLVGMQLAVHFRHIRNLTLFQYALKSEGISGRIEYRHWLNLRLSSMEFFSFTLLFLLLFFLWDSFFVLGAAVGCFSLALRHLLDSRKATKTASRPMQRQHVGPTDADSLSDP
jgi:hypothetical protein